MAKNRTFIGKILSTTIALALALGAPLCEASSVMTGRVAPVSVAGSASMAGAHLYKVQLPNLSLNTLNQPALQLNVPGLTPSLAALPSASVRQVPVLPTPVFEVISKLEASGVDMAGGATRADADKLLAAAEGLPAGAAKNNLVMLAQAISAPQASDVAGGLDKAYDNTVSKQDEVPVMAEPSGFWASLGKVGIFPRFVRRAFLKKAEKNRLRAQPRDPRTFEVPVAKLRWTPVPETLPKSTKEIPAGPERIVGQDAAVQALEFGLKMPGKGYNVFVSGLDGSGRETAVRHILRELAPTMPTPRDMLAVTGFGEKGAPMLLKLQPGDAPVFAAELEGFIKKMQIALPQVLQSDQIQQALQGIQKRFQAQVQARQEAFDAEVAKIQLGEFGVKIIMQQTEDGYALIVAPTLSGKPIKPEEMEEMIEAGVVTQAQWDQAQKDAMAAAEPFIQKFKEMMAQNSEEYEGVQKMMEMFQTRAAASVVQQLGAGLLEVAMGKNGEQDEAIEELKTRMQAERDALNEEVAKLRIGKFGAFVEAMPAQGGQLRIMMGLTLNGQPLTRAAAEEAGITDDELQAAQAEIQKAAKPYAEKLVAILQKFQGEEQAIAQAKPAAPTDADQAQAVGYVKALLNKAVKNYRLFLGAKTKDGQEVDPAEFFKASVLATNKAGNGAPVIFVNNPTYENLFGSIKPKISLMQGIGPVKVQSPGGPTMKSGAFHKANGGFLVLNVMDVVRAPGALESLMKAVRNGEAEIADGGAATALGLQPGETYSVPSKVKVVLLGSPLLRMLLSQHDDAFNASFAARADFRSVMDITKETIEGFLSFMKRMVVNSTGEVLDMTRDAMIQLLEHSARMAESNEKLSAQFGGLLALMRESTFWAKEAGRDEVSGQDVQKALETSEARNGGMKQRVQEVYTSGSFRVDVDGEKVGQINGLAVMGNFGVPLRITVVTSPGRPGIVSVDRDAGTTGSSYNKALGVVEGYLERVFGQKKALSAKFRISFEQSYGGIDGDSATSTEIYGILSSLANAAIRQNIAVTGSSDQFGNVQPIGGANHKIEGFFGVASALVADAFKNGLHGVIVPSANVKDLMLSQEVVDAVKAGHFKIYAVDHVSEGIEILTGQAYSEILRKAHARLGELRAGAMGQ